VSCWIICNMFSTACKVKWQWL